MSAYGACVFIINDDGKVLSVSRKNNKNDMGLPGGKIEIGETPLQAALRELYEETGYSVDEKKTTLLFSSERADNKTTLTYGISFNDILSVDRCSYEEGEVRWVMPKELISGTYGIYNKALLDVLKISY